MKKKEIIYRLKKNQIGIIPTDTIYGIVAKFGNDNLKNKIFEIKKRVKTKRIPILVSSFEQLGKIINLNLEIFSFLNNLKEPTTVVYDMKDFKKTIAIRLVTWKWLKEIIDETGPLYATSCNISGQEFTNLEFWKNKVNFIVRDERNLIFKSSKIIVYKTKKKLR